MFNSIQKILRLILLSAFLPGCAAVVAGTAATSVMVAQDRRTTGTIVEDKSIQIKASQAIQQVMDHHAAAHISAISYNGRVLLVGQAPTRKIRTQIEKEVRSLDKVKRVHNEITVRSPTSMLTRSSDSWITAKIKSEMAVTLDFNPTRVKVVTEDSTVYLLGLVKGEEEDIAVDIARHIKGVKKVVKLFEYEK